MDAVLLLDTEEASHDVAEMAAFVTTAYGSWVVVRGGAADSPAGRYWREAVALEPAQLARVRGNPFRILPRAAPDSSRKPYGELATPILPQVRAEDDLRRIVELAECGAGHHGVGSFKALLAAVLETEHTLVMRSGWSYSDLELLILLLPPRLRPAFTFHTHALSLPVDPIPRLVLTPLADPTTFEVPQPLWGHHLPATAAKTSRRAQQAACELIDLLTRLDLLAAAHDAYEEFVDRLRPTPGALLDETCTLLRFARLLAARGSMDVAGGLRVLTDAVAAHGGEDHPEALWCAELMRTSFAPTAVGTGVAAPLLRGGDAAVASTLLIERFAKRKGRRPTEFAQFVAPIEQAISGLTLTNGGPSHALGTLLLLLAAGRGDPDGMAAAVCLPVDADAVARAGGVDPWLPDDPALAGALRAFMETRTVEGASAAIAALGVLAARITPAQQHLRLADVAVECMRLVYRQLPPEEWRQALAIAPAALELCVGITAATRLSLHGIPEADHFREIIGRSGQTGSPPAFPDHQDAELFLGFMGAEASRSRLAAREIAPHGASLVHELHSRIRARHAGPAEATEGVHWSMVLLERVRLQELDPHYTSLAIELLRLAAPVSAGRLLRAYFESSPGSAALLITHADPTSFLNAAELEALAAVAIGDAILDASQARDTSPVAAVCEPLRAAGVQVDAALAVARIEEPLMTLVHTLRTHSPHPTGAYTTTLYRLLEPLMTELAHLVLRRALAVPASTPDLPLAVGTANLEQATSQTPTRAPFRELIRRATPLVAVATFSMTAVLLSSETGRRALPGGTAWVTGARSAAELAALDPAERLAEAREQARRAKWGDVVQLLGTDPLEHERPPSFAWDSLLAWGALRQGLDLPSDDVRRTPLLALARLRVERALELARPASPGSDFLRLVRAEACLAAALHCNTTRILEDLDAASTSGAQAVRARARQVMAAVRR